MEYFVSERKREREKTTTKTSNNATILTTLFAPFESSFGRKRRLSERKETTKTCHPLTKRPPKVGKNSKNPSRIVRTRTHRRQRAPFTFRAYVVRRGRDVVNEDFARLLHAIERVFGDVRFERRVRLRVHVRKLGELMLHDPLDVRAGEVVARRRARLFGRRRRLNHRRRRRNDTTTIRRGSSSSSRGRRGGRRGR